MTAKDGKEALYPTVENGRNEDKRGRNGVTAKKKGKRKRGDSAQVMQVCLKLILLNLSHLQLWKTNWLMGLGRKGGMCGECDLRESKKVKTLKG